MTSRLWMTCEFCDFLYKSCCESPCVEAANLDCSCQGVQGRVPLSLVPCNYPRALGLMTPYP
jgi:hypothetical protein